MALGDGITWGTGPTDATSAVQIDDYMRDLMNGVQGRMALEHEWPVSQAATAEGGKHKFLTLQIQATAPTIGGTQVSAVYMKSDATTGDALFYLNSATQELNLSDKVYFWYIGGDLLAGNNVNAQLKLLNAGRFKSVDVYAGTAPTGAAAQFDINYNGVSLWTATSSQPILAIGSTSTGITSFVTTVGARGGLLTLDCDTAGSTIAGGNVTIMLKVG